jgi:hypothetical protein
LHAPPPAPEILPAPELAPEPPQTPPQHLIAFESICLLTSTWQASAEVFLASLRRSGARDSALLSDSPARYKIGGQELALHNEPQPLSRKTLEFALTHTFDWPAAEEAVKTHNAYIRFESHLPIDGPRSETVRLHVRAQQALLEFAPVIAVLWPDSGRLAPVEILRSWRPDQLDPCVCLSFRSFELEGNDAGKTLCDTLGLHALGLHDIEVVVQGEPDESISLMLYEQAGLRLIQGQDFEEDEALSVGTHRYKMELTRSTFPPDRPVARLNPEPTDQSSSAGKSS